MRKKIFIIGFALLFIFAGSFLAYSSKEEEAKEEEVKMEEVTVQMWAGPESRGMLEVVNEWNEKYAENTGIKVSLITVGRVGFAEKVRSQLMSGVDKPDLVQAFSVQIGSVYPYLEPLEPYFGSEYFSSPDGVPYKKDAMIATALKGGEVEGKQYGIPTDISWHFMFYRKDLMDLEKNPIETWEEWVEKSKEFTRSINPDSPTPYGTALNGKLAWFSPLHYLIVLWDFGGSVFKPGTFEPDLDSEAALKAAKIFSDLSASGALIPDVESTEFPEVVAAFQNEIIALAPFWNAMYPMLTDPEQSPKIYDKMALAEIPGIRQPDGSIKRSTYFHCITLGLNKASKLKNKAFKFLSYATFGDGAEIYAKAGGAPPVYAVFTGPDAVEPYKSSADWIAEYGRPAPPFPDLQAFLEVIKVHWQRLLLGDDYKEVMRDMQADATAFMKEREYID